MTGTEIIPSRSATAVASSHSDKRPYISTATQPRPYATWLNCLLRPCLASSSKWQIPLYGEENKSFVRRQFAVPLGSHFETLYFSLVLGSLS